MTEYDKVEDVDVEIAQVTDIAEEKKKSSSLESIRSYPSDCLQGIAAIPSNIKYALLETRNDVSFIFINT